MVSIAFAARHLGVSVASIRRLCDSGTLPFYRPMGSSGHRRFRVDELDRYLSSVKSNKTPEVVEYTRPGFKPTNARSLIAEMRAERN